MIIIINGSLGVGKSCLAGVLQRKFERSVNLDGDALGDVHPFEIYDRQRVAQLYQALVLLVGFHQKNGYANFVINYVFESAGELEALLAGLRPLDPSIHIFWLTCEEQEQAARIRQRSGQDLEWELQRFVELRKIQRRAAAEGFIGQEVDTSGLTAGQTADKIWQMIGG